MVNIYHANINQKKVGVAIVILDKQTFKAKKENISKDKNSHFKMMKDLIHKEDIINVSSYTKTHIVLKTQTQVI